MKRDRGRSKDFAKARRARDLAAAEAWLLEHPDTARFIDSQLELQGYPAVVNAEAFAAICRRVVRAPLVIAAWRAGGAPSYETDERQMAIPFSRSG